MIRIYLSLSILSLLLSCTSTNTTKVQAQVPAAITIDQCLSGVPYMPATMDFCGETVPVQNFDVRESILRELNSLAYWHSSMIYTMQLANRYVPAIKAILKANKVPEDFVYLCIAESNLQNLTSPAKAVGYWQFLQGTGKEFGLEITADVDMRYDLEQSTLAACKYLNAAYAKFGNWTMAAASYNVGMGHMNSQINTQQDPSYYNLHLNIETGRYVYRAVAYKLIIENPVLYGFKLNPESLFPPLRYTEVTVNSTTDWIDFALQQGTNYKVLRLFNPWIRSAKLINKIGKSYKVRIPEKGFRETAY